jgi:pantothenate kinase
MLALWTPIIIPKLIALSLALLNLSSSSSSSSDKKMAGDESSHVQRLVDKLRSKLAIVVKEEQQEPQSQQYWIGIAGGPGSGKTTVSHAVADRLNDIEADSTLVIPLDGWHTPQAALVAKFGVDAMKRRGAPWTFDLELCAEQLALAKRNGYASLPIYSRERSDPVPNGVMLQKHHKIVLVEGLYVLWKDEYPKLYELGDERWFVQCPSREQQIERLVQRSLKTWSDAKAQLWGPGESGARKRVDFNDVQNMDLVEHCQDYANEIIITK